MCSVYSDSPGFTVAYAFPLGLLGTAGISGIILALTCHAAIRAKGPKGFKNP